MKTFFLLILISLSTTSMNAQDVTGQWNGIANIQGTNLRIVFHITKTDSGYTSTMQSPDQSTAIIPVSKTSFENGKLSIEIQRIGFQYDGELKGDSIAGIFKQGGLVLPMNLSRNAIEKVVTVRPQEPKKPYPYISKEVTFKNEKANVTLAGTLTLPEKGANFPVAILITGSGPQNRDEELMGHKPFLVISDYLTRNGIAVLRYDDRGVAKSTGDFKTATTADFATDVESAIAYLKTRKEINKKEIGLVGHSEGGVIAPMVAARSNDVAFIVMLAGTGIPGYKLLLLQQELIAKADGAPEAEIYAFLKRDSALYNLVVISKNDETLKTELGSFMKHAMETDTLVKIPSGTTLDQVVQGEVSALTSPWMQYFLKYDPAIALSKVKCPVLVLNGSHDLQVPPSANLPAIEKALKKGGNKNVTVMELPGLNHLFQESKTGAPSEYANIEQTFSPIALDAMTKWILKEVGNKK